MAKVKWLGEDRPGDPGPSFNTWNGIQFDKGKWVEVENAQMLAKARINRFYEVKEDKPPPVPDAPFSGDPAELPPVEAPKVQKVQKVPKTAPKKKDVSHARISHAQRSR